MERKLRGLSLQEGLQAVIIVGLIGLFMGFFAIFNEGVGDTASADRNTLTVTNESEAWVNATGYTVEGKGVFLAEDFTATAVWVNVSRTPCLIPAANYTLDSVTGILTNATIIKNATEYNDANVSYTYTIPTAAENISAGMNTEFENQTDILGLVLLAVFFGIAITALLASFLIRRSRL